MPKLWSFHVERAMNFGPCYSAQAKDAFPLLCRKNSTEPGTAVANFLGRRLVVGRSAVAGRHDHDVLQIESIVDVDRLKLIANSGFMQRPKQPVSRPVTGKHPSRAIGTVSSRRKTDDKEFGVGVTQGWHWFCPVFLTRKPLWRVCRHFFTPNSEPNTFGAGRNRLDNPQDF